MNKQRFVAFASLLALFVIAMSVAEFFPSTRAYLPTFQGFWDGVMHGNAMADKAQTPPATPHSAPLPHKKNNQTAVLALSWLPAFCESAAVKRECTTQTATRYDARNFSLHGLWPEAEYCTRAPYENVNGKLWQAMQTAMPSTASGLHKHEWEKHGTCYADTPDQYFADSLRLVVALNKGPVQALFVRKAGQYLASSDIRSALDAAYGKGAGARLSVVCLNDGERRLIQELRLNLRGLIAKEDIASLLAKADPANPGCQGGIVDPVGLQ